MAARDRVGAPDAKPMLYCALRGGYYMPYRRLGGWACGGCGAKVRVVA